MPTENLSMLDKLLISTIIPSTVVPFLFLIAFYRLWARLKKWAFGVIAISCALSVVTQIAQSLAVNIPRVGKTEAQVALAKDIPWLHSIGLGTSVIALWGFLIGGIGLLMLSKELYLSPSE